MTFASSGASDAMVIRTVPVVPSAVTVGELSITMPAAGVAVTAVTPWKFWPRMVMVKVWPRLLRIGVIESMFGKPTPTRNVLLPAGANSTRAVPRRTCAPRRPAAAPACTVIGADTCVPSGATLSAPSTMPSGGTTDTVVTSCSAKPEIVNVPNVLGESGGAWTPVATGPSATPRLRETAKVVGAGGAAESCSNTPTMGAYTGPMICCGGGASLCNRTPSRGEFTGDTRGPAALVMVMVFSAVNALDEVPAGVVTVTARGPVAASAAALSVTVI